MKWVVVALAATLTLLAGSHAYAQATVVATCGTPPSTLAPGTVTPLFQDTTGKLCTGATLTGGSTTLNATSTLPTLGAGSQSPQGSLAGALYDQPVFGSASGGGTQVDATHGLPVNCIVGCAGGSASNASDAVATSSTNGTTNAWLFGFNGTTFDRLRVDASKNLNVNLSANSFGTLTVGGTVTANAGTNLNTSALALDTSVNGLLLGQASTSSGQKGPLLQAAVTTAAPTYTTAQTDPLSLTTAGALRVDGSGATQPVSGTVTANAGTGTFTVGGTVTANQGGAPWSQNITQWNSVALGSPSNYGTSPGAVSVPGVNAFVTNTPSVAQSGTWNVGLSAGSNTIGKVDVLGNAGSIMDFAGQNAAQPANSLLTGCEFNTAPTTITTGNASPIQCTSAARLIVDGSQVTQPVSGTVSVNALPTGSNTIGKVDILGNAGATLDAAVGAATAPTNGQAVLGVFNTTAPAPTNGQSAALQLSALSNLLVEQGCAGQSVANTSVKPINNAASSSNLLLVTGVASKKVYICAIDVVVNAANNVALVEGTTTTNPCDTGTAGMAGGATAATGWNFAANGGLTKGNGQGIVYKEATAADNVCLFFSAASQVSGEITYVVY